MENDTTRKPENQPDRKPVDNKPTPNQPGGTNAPDGYAPGGDKR